MTTAQTLTTSVSLNGILISGNFGASALVGSGQGVYLSGGALLTTGGSNTVSMSSLDFGTAEGIAITDGSGNTTTLSSSIIGTGGLTIAGTGTLSLPNSNATNGSVTNVPVTAGGSYTAAPSVTFSGGGGTTQATGYAVLNGTAVAAIVITSGGLGYTSAPTVVLGVVSGATVATLGTATISTNNVSSTGSNGSAGSYTGTTTVNTSVTLGANNAIPGAAGGITLTNGTITANAALIIPNAVTFNANISNITFAGTGGSVLFNNAVAGTVTFAAAGGNTNLTIPSGFTVTVGTPVTVGTSVITAGGSITKIGTGTLVIAANNASATTLTTVEAGILLLQASSGLGIAGGKAIMANGTTLQVQQITSAALTTPADPITVIGSGATGTTGAIEMLGGGTGMNTIAGTVTMLGDTTIGVDVGQLTLSGIISGAAAVTKVGLGMASLAGPTPTTARRTSMRASWTPMRPRPWVRSRPAPWWPAAPRSN